MATKKMVEIQEGVLVNSMSSVDLMMLASRLVDRGMGDFDSEEQVEAWRAEVEEFAVYAGDKFLAIRFVKARLRSSADGLKEQAKRFAEAAARVENGIVRLDDLTIQLVKSAALAIEGPQGEDARAEGLRVKTSDGGWVKWDIGENSEVVVENVETLPDEFVRIKKEPDKVKIRAYLEGTTVTEDGEVVQNTIAGVEIKTTQRDRLGWSK